MSFSFTIKEEEVESTISAAIDDKIEAIQLPGAKAEAQALASSIPAVLQSLVGDRKFKAASISGSSSDAQASLNIGVSFGVSEEPKERVEGEERQPEPILDAATVSENPPQHKTGAATKADGPTKKA